jgi:DNA-binding transcriptional LysR family regulator
VKPPAAGDHSEAVALHQRRTREFEAPRHGTVGGIELVPFTRHLSSPIDVRELIYLTVVADMGNFARAAKALRIDASSVSRRLTNLEDELGLALFERSRKGAQLTSGGRAMLRRAQRVLAELDAMRRIGASSGSAEVGEIHLGVRTPPVGEPLRGLLMSWRKAHPGVMLTVADLNERDMAMALNERRLDVALIASHTVCTRAATLPIYRERLVLALPVGHHLAECGPLRWASLIEETILVQGWDGSQAQREFFASLLGSGAKFHAHGASEHTVFALVGAGFGITLTPQSQAEATFPGVVFKPIDEPNAWVQFDLAWMPEAEDPAAGRFIAFIRDEARSRRLL